MPNLFGGPSLELGIEKRAFGIKCFESGIDCPYLGYGIPGISYWKNDVFQDIGASVFLPGICGGLFTCSHVEW